MFQRIFCNEFNISFTSPASDACSLCTHFTQQIKSVKIEGKSNFILQKSAAVFYELLHQYYDSNTTVTLCFDMQQV